MTNECTLIGSRSFSSVTILARVFVFVFASTFFTLAATGFVFSTTPFFGTVLLFEVTGVVDSSTDVATLRVLLVARVGATRCVAEGVADALGRPTRPLPFVEVSTTFLERVAIISNEIVLNDQVEVWLVTRW